MNYYNENDPKAAAWLRELIAAGLIAAGHVDERSISDVTPSDLRGFIQCHFFAGIGGWSYALRLAGWPDNRPVWTGSCPCQPFSDAGEGKGFEDPRHLWPVWFPLIRECAPPVVFGEQVASKAALRWLDGVFVDLEGAAYACAAADLCAAGVNAPHIRQRLWWVAYSQRDAGKPRGVTDQSRESLGTTPEGSHAEFGRCGVSSRLGDSDTHGRKPGQSAAAANGYGRSSRSDGSTCGVGHSFQSRLEGHSGHGDDRDQPGRNGTQETGSASATGIISDFWGNFDILPCLDGKARRVESGTFPLAHGIPGRMGLLRGYGNAIVPEVAAEFIRAAEEALIHE